MTDLATINELFPTRTESTDRATNSVDELGSDAFLQLMVAQMENQDPTKPIENTEFVAQLAQFGTVSGVQELNESFAGLSSSLASSQSWQAASLVDRSVVTESNLGQLEAFVGPDGEVQMGLAATVDFEGTAAGGNIYVQDLTGRLVYSTALPSGVTGELQVQWDGLDNDGKPMEPGSYRISAESALNGQNTAIPVYAHQRVDSVAIDSTSGGVTLNLSGGGSVAVNEVKQFL
ncbi:MAG: flagellar hook assembly protein FlgD [Congregibacter sp.]